MSQLPVYRLFLELALLVSLLSVWQRSGAALAFASAVLNRWQLGTRGLQRLIWIMGLFFFQSGTFSAIVVGSTLRALKDRLRLPAPLFSFYLDSMASPLAALLMLNAWPAFLLSVLADPRLSMLPEELRQVQIIWHSLPLSFYSIGIILLSFCMAWGLMPKLSSYFQQAEPEAVVEDLKQQSCENNPSRARDFAISWLVMFAWVLISLVWTRSVQLAPAFGLALLASLILARRRAVAWSLLGLALLQGLKKASLVVLIILGAFFALLLSPIVPSGENLGQMLKSHLPLFLLPMFLQAIAMSLSFMIGTSWGTFLILIPSGLSAAYYMGPEAPYWFFLICFAAMKDGAVFGDQSSPFSDTSIAAALMAGCPLRVHVRRQLPVTLAVSALASGLWTLLAILVL